MRATTVPISPTSPADSPDKLMTHELAPVPSEPSPPAALDEAAHQVVIPATIMEAGDQAAYKFFEFFTANVPNANTRRAYFRAACHFFAWTQEHRLSLPRIKPPHVAAYIQERL